MSKRAAGIIAPVIVAIGAALVWGYHLLSGPRGKLITQLEKKDAGGYTHTVTVRQLAGRFNTELGEQGSLGRVLRASSYEFYEGSHPITAATIKWPDLHKFTVSFSNGATIECSWSETN